MPYSTVVEPTKWKVDELTVIFPLGEGLVTLNFPTSDRMKAFGIDLLQAASGEKLSDLVSALTLTETEDTDGDVVEIPDTPQPVDTSAEQSSFFVDPVVAADEERALFGISNDGTDAEEEQEAEDTVADLNGNDSSSEEQEEGERPNEAVAADSSSDEYEYAVGVSQELYRRSNRSRYTRITRRGF